LTPGPVSDSYDPEFGTAENASIVHDAVKSQADRISKLLGPRLLNIVEVVRDENTLQTKHSLTFSEQELRVIRFGLNRALESL
jgi:hypothetical protein